MSSAPLTEALAERLNDRYWNSGRTIDEIVGSEGVSRNRLYESVRPFTTGKSCPTCGEELVFPNRRSRDGQTAICTGCGREATVEEPVDSVFSGDSASPAQSFGDVEGLAEPDGWDPSDRKKAMIGGAAALGVMLGAAATRVLKD